MCIDRIDRQNLEDDVGGEKSGDARRVAVGEDFDDIGTGQRHAAAGTDERERLRGCESTDAGRAGARREGGVHNVDVEREVCWVGAEASGERFDGREAGTLDVGVGEDGHAVVASELKVVRSVQRSLDTNREHLLGIDEPVLDRAAEGGGVPPLLSPDCIDGVEMAVKVQEGETAFGLAVALPCCADVRVGDRVVAAEGEQFGGLW